MKAVNPSIMCVNIGVGKLIADIMKLEDYKKFNNVDGKCIYVTVDMYVSRKYNWN